MLILSSPQITIIKPLFNYYISQTRTQVKSFGKLTLSKFICIVVDKKNPGDRHYFESLVKELTL